MKFIRIKNRMYNPLYIQNIFESHDKKSVCIVYNDEKDFDIYLKTDWNNAVRIFHPDMQWID